MNSGILSGRGAVVTGGGRGIGAAVARTLSAAGAGVVVAARTSKEVELIAAELRAGGAQAWSTVCDVADEGSVKRLGDEARRCLERVDILVNNAGTASSAPLRRVPLTEWNLMFAVNATGTFLCTREFVPGMVQRGWGRVVNVASIAGLEGAKYVSHYCAAKHAVIGFTRSIALEMAKTGITVNAVCPGYTDTTMTDRTLAVIESRTGLPHEDVLLSVLATTGQGRLVTPEEVAAEVIRLCGEDASDLNGQIVVLRPGVLKS